MIILIVISIIRLSYDENIVMKMVMALINCNDLIMMTKNDNDSDYSGDYNSDNDDKVHMLTLVVTSGYLGLKFHIKIPNSKYNPNPNPKPNPNSYDNALF